MDIRFAQAKDIPGILALLRQVGLVIPDRAVRQGIARAKWPGRFERLSEEPLILSDGAHNPEGVEAAVASIKAYFKEPVLLLSGVMADKDYDGMIEGMKPIVEQIFTVTPSNPRALAAKDYAEQIRAHGIQATPFEDLDSALKAAVADAQEKGIPLLCLGSLYLYGELAPLIERLD